MNNRLLGIFALAAPFFAATVRPVEAAPRQVVVVVADGLNAQSISFGAGYVKKVADDAAATSALGDLPGSAKAGAADGFNFESLRGILKKAAASGYKTGLVTTDSVAKDAATLYDVTAAADVAKANYNFIAGGGRAEVPADALAATGAKVLTTANAVEEFEGNAEGKTVILQSDAALSYAVDQNPENEAAFGELVSLGMQNLAGENDSPYLLVVHETRLPGALAAKDSPAVAEQLAALDSIVSDINGSREENDSLAAVVFAGGGAVAPRFGSTNPADQSNSYFILSQLSKSFAGAGASLKGANDEAITAFATDEYKGWKVSAENRAGIIAGTVNAETAIRASYEPVLNIGYEQVAAQPTAYGLGIDGANAVATLNAWAGAKPAGAKTP